MVVRKVFYYLVMLFFSTCLSIAIGFSKEDATNDSNNDEPGITHSEILLQDKGVQGALGDINAVSVFFCNGGELTYDTFLSLIPGEEKALCLRYENRNHDNVKFESHFLDASLSMAGFKSCEFKEADNSNGLTKSIVGDFVNEIEVPAGSYVEKSLKLKFPVGYSGLYHFCHYYKLIGQNANIPMFNVTVHKSNYIDILVNSENVKLSGSVTISKFSKDKENVFFSLKNEFPFDQEVRLYAVISNVFGFEKEIVLDADVVRYNNSKDFVINIGDLPYYKGPFSMAIKIKYKPRFDFDPKNSGIDQDILDGGEMNQVINFFVFDKVQFIILAVLLIFIFLIKMAFFTKPKVVYVEEKKVQ